MLFRGVSGHGQPPIIPTNRGIEGNGGNETFFQENGEFALSNGIKLVILHRNNHQKDGHKRTTYSP